MKMFKCAFISASILFCHMSFAKCKYSPRGVSFESTDRWDYAKPEELVDRCRVLEGRPYKFFGNQPSADFRYDHIDDPNVRFIIRKNRDSNLRSCWTISTTGQLMDKVSNSNCTVECKAVPDTNANRDFVCQMFDQWGREFSPNGNESVDYKCCHDGKTFKRILTFENKKTLYCAPATKEGEFIHDDFARAQFPDSKKCEAVKFKWGTNPSNGMEACLAIDSEVTEVADDSLCKPKKK